MYLLVVKLKVTFALSQVNKNLDSTDKTVIYSAY